ncbi:hypothetical protein Pmani_025002 [Petrolisthes manimaculis]|uniref:Uncharacterized protein n=1 Tax=Petrolisthes manimaculis TaxID=1843537 RepID=A0AAE1U1M2_9EUCA|nr:hypothetical protein Pmani_025002 [Petrolisthes manimaculis]
MLITTLFLLFVLTTVALLIFLLMRRPPCCPCCHDPYDASASAAGSTGSQAANITYLTESHGIVVKKWMKDSPPPYESPPDYNSLSPELIMDAKTLSELVGSGGHPPIPNSTTSSNTQPTRSSSPLCTTPLFSPGFCDTPRSLTPTIHHDAKAYECPPSPLFSHHQYSSPAAPAHCHPPPTTYAASGTVQSPPTYESVPASRRKDDNQ